MSLATDSFIGPQVLTLAIPLGTLFVVMFTVTSNTMAAMRRMVEK